MKSMERKARGLLAMAALVLGAASGCKAAGGAVVNAALNTAVAAGASAASRAAGGCYASCPWGTTCDEHSGLCVALPCRGRCGPGERCVEQGATERCEAAALAGDLQVNPPSSKDPGTRTPAASTPAASGATTATPASASGDSPAGAAPARALVPDDAPVARPRAADAPTAAHLTPDPPPPPSQERTPSP